MTCSRFGYSHRSVPGHSAYSATSTSTSLPICSAIRSSSSFRCSLVLRQFSLHCIGRHHQHQAGCLRRQGSAALSPGRSSGAGAGRSAHCAEILYHFLDIFGHGFWQSLPVSAFGSAAGPSAPPTVPPDIFPPIGRPFAPICPCAPYPAELPPYPFLSCLPPHGSGPEVRLRFGLHGRNTQLNQSHLQHAPASGSHILSVRTIPKKSEYSEAADPLRSSLSLFFQAVPDSRWIHPEHPPIIRCLCQRADF